MCFWKVVDESGAALFDATVELKSASDSESIRTDDTGFFSFAVASGAWSLTSYKAGYVTSASQSLVVEDGQALDTGTLILQAASNDVNGTVTFASDNQPLQGTIVKAQKGELVYETTTSNQGRFKFSLEAGVWEITIDSQGFVAAPPSYSVNLDAGDVVSAPFRLFEGSVVSGTVSFAGRQLQGARLKAFDKESNTLAQVAETNLQGFYAMGLRPGDYWLEASSENFLQRRRAITITSNQTIEENFALTEAGFVSGTVSNQEASAPIAGAMVFVVDDPTLSAVSDSQGSYILGLPPGQSFLIDASLPGFGSVDGPVPVTTTVGETVTQSFTLKALSGMLSGHVTDGAFPVSGAEVDVEKLDLVVFTDGSGAFEVEIPPGSYTVNASKECHLPASQNVEIVAGVTNDLAITLRTLQSIITGKVTDIVGTPLENAQVTATGDTTFTDSTDADGAYRLCLNSGIYRVQAMQPGFLPADTTLVVSEGDSLGGVDFVLADNFARVTGSVLDTLGNPVASASVILTNENQTLSTSTDFTGAFAFARVIPGLSEIRPAKEGLYGEKIDIFLQGRQQEQVTLILHPADGFIKGTVRNSQDGSAIADVRISAQLNGNSDFFVTQTTGNGTYELSGLPVIPGRNFAVFAFKEGFFTPASVNNVSAKTDSVDFFLVKRVGIISGVVVEDEINEPLAGVRVEALHSSGNRSSAFSDSTGRFQIQNLIPAEIYDLTATKSGFFSATQESIVAGDTSVSIILSRKFGFVFGKVTDVVSNAPLDNIPIQASPIGLAGQEAQVLTDINGEYQIRLIADFYSIKPAITHHLSTPDSVQLEVTEVDTVVGIDFALETQTVESISVRRVDSDNPDFLNSERPRFEATARDANGTVVNMGRPIWSLNVSERAATIDSTGKVQLALDFFGELIVTATDPISKKQGKVNPIPSVFAQIDSSTDIILFDDRGLQL
ncbi:MAG: carboxypeptidase regulatory-like domain-containing protein, partial [bacterium]